MFSYFPFFSISIDSPVVHFANTSTVVIEGHDTELNCLADGNPPVKLLYITLVGSMTVQASCEDMPNCRLRFSGVRQDRGTYTCIAQNEGGEAKVNITVKVLCT